MIGYENSLEHRLNCGPCKKGDLSIQDKRIALVTGANQGVGFQVAKELVAKGLTVLVGSRNFERGQAAAEEIGPGTIALQVDVTDRVSIADAAERIRNEFGRLDVLVQNAAISNTRKGNLSLQEYAKITRPSNASLDEVRVVWETNVFGVLAVYQAMLPGLRQSADARIVNVSSASGLWRRMRILRTHITRCSGRSTQHPRQH